MRFVAQLVVLFHGFCKLVDLVLQLTLKILAFDNLLIQKIIWNR
jgi:hypothetical protein